jgi:hypothetical protein
MDKVLVERISKLQEVMTSMSYLTQFPDEMRLSSKKDYSRWYTAFDMKLRLRGLGIRDYLQTGDVGTFDGSTSDQLRKLEHLMNEILTQMVYASVKGFVLDSTVSSGLDGRALVVHIQNTFGSVSILNAVGLGSDVFGRSGAPSLEEALSGFNHFKSQVVDRMSSSEVCSVLLLVSLSRTLSIGQLKELVTAYHSNYGTDMSGFTTGNLSRLCMELFSDSSSTSNHSSALVAKTFKRDAPGFKNRGPIQCYNCQQLGHVWSKCPELNEKMKENMKNKQSGKPGWFAFFGKDDQSSNVYLDSGCSDHIFANSTYFSAITPITNKYITSVNGDQVKVEGIGNVELLMQNGRSLSLTQVLFIPTAAANLVSVSKATGAGAKLMFVGDTVIDASYDSRNSLGVKSEAHGGLYRLLVEPPARPTLRF